jgi:hypothetical protein
MSASQIARIMNDHGIDQRLLLSEDGADVPSSIVGELTDRGYWAHYPFEQLANIIKFAARGIFAAMTH